MRILLIRHAKSVDAAAHKSQRDNSPLSDEGIRHIANLSSTMGGVSFDAIYSSPYVRAKQTARLLFPGELVTTINTIHEIKRPISLDGGNHADAVAFWEVLHKQSKHDPEWTHDGSETFTQAVGRVTDFIEYLYKHHSDSDTVAVVTHGGFMKHTIGYTSLGQKYSTAIFFDMLYPLAIDNLGCIELELNDKSLKSWKVIA